MLIIKTKTWFSNMEASSDPPQALCVLWVALISERPDSRVENVRLDHDSCL